MADISPVNTGWHYTAGLHADAAGNHGPTEEDMQEQTDEAQGESRWVRILYMILFGVLFKVAEFVMWVTVAFQVLMTLISGAPNAQARRFGQSLSLYVCEIWRYLTYNSELKPFPLGEWPMPSEEAEDAGEPRS
jgi:hypothetical protein